MPVYKKRIPLDQETSGTDKHLLFSDKDMAVEETREVKDIQISSEATVLHDKHDRIVLPPGHYRTCHQVEFNPMDGQTTRVFD